MSILEQILQAKRIEVDDSQKKESLDDLKKRAKLTSAPRGFVSLINKTQEPAIIAEVKRASPSKGLIRADLDPVKTALAFASNGAAAVSVLTDSQFFSGEKSFIPAIKAEFNSASFSPPPILRKDFIIAPYQVWETRAMAADALLLIVAALSENELASLLEETLEAELDVLLEVHNLEELETAVKTLAQSLKLKNNPDRVLLGINNRDLNTFETKLSVTKELSRRLETIRSLYKDHQSIEKIKLVSESGIFTGEDLSLLSSYGAGAFLIGESLVASGIQGRI